MIILCTPIFKLAEFCTPVFSGRATDFWREICLGTISLYNFGSELFCLEFFNMDDRQFCILILGFNSTPRVSASTVSFSQMYQATHDANLQ